MHQIVFQSLAVGYIRQENRNIRALAVRLTPVGRTALTDDPGWLERRHLIEAEEIEEVCNQLARWVGEASPAEVC